MLVSAQLHPAAEPTLEEQREASVLGILSLFDLIVHPIWSSGATIVWF